MSEETRSLSIEVVYQMVHMNLPCEHVLDITPEQARDVAGALEEAATVAESPETVQ